MSILVDEWHIENVNEVIEKTDYEVKLIIISSLSGQVHYIVIKGNQIILLNVHARLVK